MRDALAQRLEARLESHPDQVVRVIDGSSVDEMPWGRVVDVGMAMARDLRAAHEADGGCVALSGRSTLALVGAVCGSLACGVPFTILPSRARGQSEEAHADALRRRCRIAGVNHVWADTATVAEGLAAVGVTGSSLDTLWERARGRGAPQADLGVTTTPIVQFTSGTTGDPRGVTIRGDALVANTAAIADRRRLDPDGERFMSWLPLYHDMGLVAMVVLPLLHGGDLTLADPSWFVRRPERWMEACSTQRATFTAAPNFAFALAQRAGAGGHIELRSLHTVVDGGEPILPEVIEGFTAAFGEVGLAAGAVACSYGLAENTVGVSHPHRGDGLRRLAVDGVARPVASLGPPLAGTEVAVAAGSSGAVVGEVLVRGDSLSEGYMGSEPFATAGDGWVATGDLGAIVDGELAVVGRADDVIVCRGRNLSPDVFEAAAAEAGARRGSAIAVSVGGEEVYVVAEPADLTDGRAAHRIRTTVTAEVGVSPTVLLVERGSIPKTSSGKLQRHLVRTWIDEDRVPLLS